MLIIDKVITYQRFFLFFFPSAKGHYGLLSSLLSSSIHLLPVLYMSNLWDSFFSNLVPHLVSFPWSAFPSSSYNIVVKNVF
jgi:hypothetical protein